MCNNIVYINRGLPPTEKSDTFRHKKELILMPWEERNVTKAMLRKEFVERVLAHEKSKKALCLEYGISRPTGDSGLRGIVKILLVKNFHENLTTVPIAHPLKWKHWSSRHEKKIMTRVP